MLLFCPTCGNVLIVEEGQKCMRFACNTCPYIHNITRKVSWVDMIPLHLSWSSFLGIIRIEAYRRTFSSSQVNNRKYPKLKEVDDVLGGAAAWENVDSTAGNLNALCYSIFCRISQLTVSTVRLSGAPNWHPTCVYRNVSQVWAPPGVFHADSDQISWWADDDFLQMLQCSVWTQMERLNSLHFIYFRVLLCKLLSS